MRFALWIRQFQLLVGQGPLWTEGVDRHAVFRRLRDQGIQTSIHYPPIHQFSYYQR